MNGKYLEKALRLALVTGLAGITLTASAQTPPAAPPSGYNDAGVQLNRTREYLEREQISRRIQEEREKQRSEVEEAKEGEQAEASDKILFVLKKVVVDASQVLDNNAVEAITAKYVGQEVSLQKLNTMVAEINKLYEDKGYLTCRAVLPPQTIKGGIVHISLVEGRTGKLIIEGNKSTGSKYIKNRLRLTEGEINNIHTLKICCGSMVLTTCSCVFSCRPARRLGPLIM